MGVRGTEIVRDEKPIRFAGQQNFEREKSPLHSPAAFEVEIEELVLHGLNPADRYAIAEGVERELATLFERERPPWLWQEHGHIERLNGGTIHLGANAAGRMVGEQVAQALYKTVGSAQAYSRRGNIAPEKGKNLR
ncbi:MAG TPA: hypothetical protein VMG82_28210 [Candidatus Sulfotelmatobacter sp.]|jgi:hypothetical protein|nr:hypothetical protein [Candidatus Sulfotelmatobacter sp.]